MHRSNGISKQVWVSALFCSAALLFLSPPSEAGLTVQQPNFRLLDGSLIQGKFDVQRRGLYHHTLFGGELHRWSNISPDSLPASLLSKLRAQFTKNWEAADRYFQREEIEKAKPLYAELMAVRHFLTPEELERLMAEDVSKKAKGYVLHNGEWVLFSAKQREQGLSYYRGKWRPTEHVKELKAYRRVFKRVRSSTEYEQSIMDLELLMGEYPDSKYNPLARKLIAKLMVKLEADDEFEDVEVVAAKEPARRSKDWVQHTSLRQQYVERCERVYRPRVYVTPRHYTTCRPVLRVSPRPISEPRSSIHISASSGRCAAPTGRHRFVPAVKLRF